MSVQSGLYSGATFLAAPILRYAMRRKHQKMSAPASRLRERFGHATLPRPDGTLIWCHAASMGELRAVLPVIQDLMSRRSDVHFLISTTTQTGAEMAEKLGDRVTHQFGPLDLPGIAARFVAHWRPNMAVIVENELLPRLTRHLSAKNIPQVTLNLRPSRTRQKLPTLAGEVLNRSEFITANSASLIDEAPQMGLSKSKYLGGADLKSSADPLPIDPVMAADLARQIGNRPCWLACSVHPEDDEIVLQAHEKVLQKQPDTLLILVPRHPDRAAQLATMIDVLSLKHMRRSSGQGLAESDQILLADTMGETGLFFAQSAVTLLGGSFGQRGGHNPWEPAVLGSYTLYGPDVKNATEAYEKLRKIGMAQMVQTADDIASLALMARKSTQKLDQVTQAGRALRGQIVDRILDLI
ncbi:3-deoxy-D-manno-octulosonic acid transferase [Aestuariibius sp. HNIBRBA575]|uniref:3-deoxy-D-manno-octulosonic acid transferase n=1 Tax=Aestuariibius sp. HNIBRBA575 TaxID=3233343 RepID=UPI0034A4E0AF